MSQSKNRIDVKTHKTATAMLIVFALFAIVIVVRLGYLQILKYDYYQGKVLSQLTQSTEVNPSRGNIYDTNGNLIATNITSYLIFISPQDVIEAMAEDDEEQAVYSFTSSDGNKYHDLKMNELIAHSLSEILDVDYDEIIEKAAKKNSRYAVIKRGVSEELADEVRALISQYDLTQQIYVRASTTRYYPYADLASHVIGFTNADGIGIYGIEKSYNNIMEGTTGKYITAQDALNNNMPFEYESYIEAEDGLNIKSTLDMYIQYELENQLKQTLSDNKAAERVTGIVMDVKTGAILAMATAPSFDLNSPYELDDLSKEVLSSYDKNSDEYTKEYYDLLYRMWNNKAVNGLYEPGSTFKIITTAMALEEKVVKLTDLFTCTGGLTIEGWSKPISCHKAGGHGTVTFAVGLQQSCNPTLMMVAQRIGKNAFYDYLKAFGYNEKTGIDLPSETAPIISSKSDFTNLSLAVYSFGQTFKVTALQQLTAISAVANGGYLVTPHVLDKITDNDGNVLYEYDTTPVRQVISESVCKTIAQVLEEGVSGNGGAKNAYVKGYKVAAKTGTSEKKDKKDENGEYSYRVGSCVAFAPADDPRIAVIIVVDEPMGGSVYGSVVAAPYVSNLLSFVLPYIGIEPQYSEEEMTVTVPGYVGSTLENAVNDLTWRDISYEIVGNGDTVTAQMPESGAAISRTNGKIILYTGSEEPKATVEMPNLVGKSVEAANRILVNLGLNVSISGASNGSSATVISQSIEAGTMVAPATVVNITVRHLNLTD